MRKNRKVKYTKERLSLSLIELLKTKHISEITITELCDHADINRTTFYRHYEKVLDLLKEIETKLLKDLETFLMQFKDHSEDYEESLFILEKIFEYIRTNEETFNVLFTDTGSLGFKTELVNLFYKQVVKIYENSNTFDDYNEEKLTYVLFGSIALVQKWLADNEKYSNKQMSKFMFLFAKEIIEAKV